MTDQNRTDAEEPDSSTDTLSAPPDEVGASRPGLVIAVLAFSGIVVSLMQTLIVPLVPLLPELLNSTPGQTTWVVTATLLAGGVATPVMGRLGDMYGKRRMLLLSLVMLVVGSALGALSSTAAPMILARTLQGLAVGLVPLGISVMRDVLPPARLSPAIALMSASLGVGGALGVPLATFVAERADWNLLFWASAALGALALVLVPVCVSGVGPRAGGRFDLLGTIGLSAALLCLLVGITQGAAWGWTDGRILGLFLAAVVLFVLWGFWELRVPNPLVNLRTSMRRQVLLTNIASTAFGYAMFTMFLLLPQLLQLPAETGHGLGQGLFVAGLVMAPSGLVMMAMAPFSVRVSRAYGFRGTLAVGAVLVATGYGLNLVFMSSVWHLVAVSAVIGAGIGFSFAAMPALVMAAVPASESASANSLNTLMRSLGTSTASAVAGTILAHMTVPFGSGHVPSLAGFQLVMVLGVGTALIALVLALFLPRPHKPT